MKRVPARAVVVLATAALACAVALWFTRPVLLAVHDPTSACLPCDSTTVVFNPLRNREIEYFAADYLQSVQLPTTSNAICVPEETRLIYRRDEGDKSFVYYKVKPKGEDHELDLPYEVTVQRTDEGFFVLGVAINPFE